jgi:hypothetical protein
MVAFSLGALVPLLAGTFIDHHNTRVAVVGAAPLSAQPPGAIKRPALLPERTR